MDEINPSYTRTADQVVVRQNTLIRQVYAWMGAGLAITAFMALITLSSPAILSAVTGKAIGKRASFKCECCESKDSIKEQLLAQSQIWK